MDNPELEELERIHDQAHAEYQWWLKIEELGHALCPGGIPNKLARKLFHAREAAERAHVNFNAAARQRKHLDT